MRRFHALLAAALLWTALPSAAAQQPKATLYVTRNRVVVGDTVRVNIEVTNVERIFSREFPKPEGLEVIYGGHEIVSVTAGGSARNSVIFRYIVTALKPGDYTLGPAVIKTEKGVLKTRTATLTAVKASASAAAQKPVSIEIEVEPDGEVYLHQPVLLALRLVIPYRDINRYSISVPWLHEFKGFRSIDPDDLQGKVSRGRRPGIMEVLISGRKALMSESARTRAGARLRVLELRRVLIPIETGKFALGASQATIQLVVGRKPGRDLWSMFDEQLITKTHDAVSQSGTLNVLPLPQEGKPIGFAGAVGEFALTAEVTPRECAQGDTVTLLVKIEGKGDLDLIPAPLVPPGRGYKVLEPEIETTLTLPLQGARTFRFPVYVSGTGDVELPKVSFTYFDASRRQYYTLEAGPFTVGAREGGTGRVTDFAGRPGRERRRVDDVGHDISDIVTDIETLDNHSPVFLRIVPLILLVVVAVAAMAAAWFGRSRRLITANPRLMRKREARQRFRTALRSDPDAGTAAGTAAETAHAAFKRYIADISGGSAGPEATPDDAAAITLAETSNSQLAGETRELLSRLEHALFRPDAPAPAGEAPAIIDLAKRIEKARRRR